MSIWSRIVNPFRADRVTREIDEELESHLAEAIEQGRHPAEARAAFGPLLRTREQSRDIRLFSRLDSLRADSVFAWRQLWKRKVTSAAAVLSLALAIGACTAAFRLIDALLLRPLPVSHPERLYMVARQGVGLDGASHIADMWAYPAFQSMRAAVKDRADLLAVSYAQRFDITYRSDAEMEKACVQYVSGSLFDAFGLHPSLGRLLTANDDLRPGAHPYAVLSYDYWSRRFARDPAIVGRSMRMGDVIFEIVGIGPAPFTGTETGTVTDIFLPAMMNPVASRDDNTWHRTLALLHPGAALEPVRAQLYTTSRAFEEERAKGFTNMPRSSIQQFLDLKLVLLPSASGASGLQQDYRLALIAIGVLVALVLLIACANVANLMAAQAASRPREMALRVSIGAGRSRLVQLMLVESSWMAFLSAALGGWMAWWSAPFVVSRINPPDNPARLALPADWRVLAFGIALTFAVTLLFGLAPALRASKVNPAGALRGGANDLPTRRRLMHALIAAQVAFCFLLLFVAGLFTATFDHLSHRALGFTADGVLTLEAIAPSPQSDVFWTDVADRLRTVPGVQSVALAGWQLLSGEDWNGFVSVNGAPSGPTLAHFIRVSPGWIDTMKLSLLDGRDFRPEDAAPGAALVNEAFVRQFLSDMRPLETSIAKGTLDFRIVGVVRDAPYRNIHEPMLPVVYVPFHSGQPSRAAALVVRTAGANPLTLASTLRRQVTRARVGNVRGLTELVQAQSVRERLLAALGLFFAAVALLLAAVGLYGVLDYSVLQRRREIAIRMAIGAQPAGIARGVTADVFRMVLAGALGGLGLGPLSVRYIQSLLYQVRPSSLSMLAAPTGILLAAALLAALPPALRAIRTDPAIMLRAD